ncbi:DEKNAAC104045 [Brettanomyces naardenensis]|uniref:DEKNAAC104045 n=1 Tax=Brettanomyces naardenensis TaxID=13370 RepID=A0A448YQ47_BRENA|nr:DEKNAAC104045 [Brettanomyces naardenensis]
MSLPGYNHYFKLGGKDIWSFINETAAAQEKKSGSKVVNLGQGFFSYAPPDFAIAAAKKALDVPMNNQYAHARGKPNLLSALADTYSTRFGRELSTDEIQVTTGANEGMLSVFIGLLERGDEVIVFQPFFDQYIPNIELAGGKVVYVKLNPPADFGERTVTGDEWTIDWKQLEASITDKTKMIVINSPYNPIGKVFNEQELTRIGNLAIKHNFYVVSDEVYENLYYIPKLTRLNTLSKEIARRTLTIGSAGKTFAATGWRIGWVIGDKEVIPAVTAAHTRICFSTPAPLQEAVASALQTAKKNDYYSKMRQQYIHKYEIFNKVFDELKIPYTVTAGGYYLLVNFKKVKIPEDYVFPPDIQGQKRDFKLAIWLIQEFGVVAIPPSVFYLEDDGYIIEDCLRFAICKTDDVLEEAVTRLRGLKEFIAE